MKDTPEHTAFPDGERRRLEERVRELEKLGRSVGHDLNNALGSLLVNAQLVLEQLPPDSPIRADIEEMHKAGERASALANRLLEEARSPKPREDPG